MRPRKARPREYFVTVSADVHARLKAAAKERGVSMASLVDEATADVVAKEQGS